MADKLLKSITFPDLTDRYIIGDTSLSVSGAGADAKATGDALATKANIDGSYEDLTAGTANQINTSVRANDKVPYLFRTSGGSVDIGDREYVNGIVGGTVAWNQLFTVSEGTPKTNQYAGMTPDVNINVINEHKYLLSFLQPAGCRVYSQNVTNLTVGSKSYPAPTTDTLQGKIVTATATALTYMGSIISKSETTETAYKLTECMFIDLTQAFGTTIADYIYSLETANAGAGVAWFKKLFNKPYYAYNAGELKSVSGLVSHNMTGFNQWDEEWEVGTINTTTGNNETANNMLRSKNYIPVVPNQAYYVPLGSDNKCWNNVFVYDANKSYIGLALVTNSLVTIPSGGHYIRFRTVTAYGTTYKDDICINISWDGSRNGEYEPYVKHSYPLDSDLTLRGIPKLDADNKLYYDGDTYESDGTVTRKYGIVDLGTLTWTYKSRYGTQSESMFQSSTITGMANFKTDDTALIPNIIVPKYTTVNGNWQYAHASYGTVSAWADSNNNPYVLIRDSAYTSASDFKTAMNGVYLVYELATPTTETADAYVGTEIVNDFGTEEFVLSDSVFPVPVGHDTDYPINMVAKLEMAPNSPDGNGDYIVRQTNGMNEYVPLVIEDALPTIPSTAGTYTLTVTVAEGSDPVLAWTAE